MTENTKFLIILAYYKRPKMVLNALNSIKELKYTNWQLDFIDDSGDDAFKGDLFRFGLDNTKVKYIPIYDTDENKKLQGGSRHGHFMNESIKNSDADVVIILCDDDAIIEDGLNKLDEFYTKNPEIRWSYSFVKYYNPMIESVKEASENYERIRKYGYTISLNENHGPTSPANRCDSSQVTFRRSNFIEKEIWYPSPLTRALDYHMYTKMYENYGPCYPTFEYVQYKGIFSDQLGSRPNNNIITVK